MPYFWKVFEVLEMSTKRDRDSPITFTDDTRSVGHLKFHTGNTLPSYLSDPQTDADAPAHAGTVTLKNCRTINCDWCTNICLLVVIDDLLKNNRKRRIILNNDNASSHTAKQTNKFLMDKKLELMSNPPYSFDLKP
ncbi:hypothetical protein EVAR_695_1 [Eumeta japonica]|uniref:Mariner Mos1 transposase n=1 Tax=Eumeta variegata TaxID=151549 RepID=A0A4C1SCE8_EUMVA|nr:hypothetical protein EVAR_695_1 [Eumeta japonica]